MSEELEPQNPANTAGDSVAEADGESDKLVPVSESIKYRRRAQQAEGRLQQAQQQLGQLQEQVEQRLDQLATAEAQRDELQHQLDTQCLRHFAEKALLSAGADKVSINTAAVADVNVVKEAARRVGSQCVVVAVDVKEVTGRSYRWEVFTHGGRRPTDLEAVEWAVRAVEMGAGELLRSSALEPAPLFDDPTRFMQGDLFEDLA
jgi:hypothetical protein